MRRLSAAVTCLALVPVLGGLAACSTSDGTPPATTTTAAINKQAGAEGAPALGPGKFAMFLLEGVFQGAGAQGYNFLSDLLTGDSSGVTDQATTAKLDEISTQLQQIKTRLDTIDSDVNSIKSQLASDQLSGKLDTMNGWNNKMTTVYTEYFLPVASAAKDVSVAKQNIEDFKKSCGATASPTTSTATSTATSTPTTCTTPPPVPSKMTDALAASITRLNDAKTLFNTGFMQADPYTVFADQHDALYPKDPNVFSVLKLAGRSLESKGYATWTDSQRLKNLYLPLSDQEALSALLIIEHDRMFGADAETQKRHKDEYASNHAVEDANLPTEIPWARVKVGSRLYMTPTYPQDTSHGAWLPISPEGKQLGTYNPLDKEKANPGWSLPTDAELTALFNGTKNTPIVDSYIGVNNKGPTTHLGSIWANSGYQGSLAPHRILAEQEAMSDFGQPWYWTKDTSQSNPLQCTVAQSHTVTRTYTLHHIGHMASDTVDGFIQGQPGRIPDTSFGFYAGTDVDCDNQLVSMYNKEEFSGNVILTQPIPADVDYMAQRSTALQPPTTTPTTSPTTGS